MELYFNVHEVTGKQNIFFLELKLEGHALTWWESDAVSRAIGNDPPVINWEVFKNMIKSQFYPIGYEEHQQIVWNYFNRDKDNQCRSSRQSSGREKFRWESLSKVHTC
jgi:hypothetical protein